MLGSSASASAVDPALGTALADWAELSNEYVVNQRVQAISSYMGHLIFETNLSQKNYNFEISLVPKLSHTVEVLNILLNLLLWESTGQKIQNSSCPKYFP